MSADESTVPESHSPSLSASKSNTVITVCRFGSHFSDQNGNPQIYLFNLPIIVSLVHIRKAVSHFFEQVANALHCM
jgi:hypothetical protein